MGQKFFKRQKAEDTEGMAFPARLARLIIRRRGLIESVFAAGCLFSLLALCCALNVDAQQALERVLEKYEARLRKKGSAGSR